MPRLRYRKLTFRERIDLNPDIGQGLVAVFLFILAGLSILSFFSLAGVAGHFIDSFLSLVFGRVRYAFPLVLIIVAILKIKDLDYEYRPTHWLGAILFFLSVNGMVHMRQPFSEMVDGALQGYGGGICGLALAWPLTKYLGFWGGVMILAGLFLVSIIFLFNTSLAQLVALNKKAILLLGWLGRQVIGFFGHFRKEKVKFSVNGDYDKTAEPKVTLEDDDEEEEKRQVFERRSMVREEEKTEAEEDSPAEAKVEEMIVEKPKRNYDLPSLSLLVSTKSKPTSGDIKGNAETIKDMLFNFGIEVEMGEVRVGPTVTQYSLKPAKGIKLTRITALSNDLSLALAAHPIRIEAPIPGKSLVGIEVPNQKVAMVTLRELLESKEFGERPNSMHVALGKDVAGKVWFADLSKMPHLLIAGATGSGKTVCINTLILSLLYQNTPDTLRFIMIDPKRVELTLYNGIPHLLTPVITDPVKTVNALRWVIGEMERRFEVLAASGRRDIQSYNKGGGSEPMPYIVFVVDELADLMAASAPEVEAGIIRIAQMARAVGIHLVVATQRPSVDIITGLMKANIPARVAFSVASVIDSRTILDCPGAEKLLGRGDMLFLTAELTKPKRLQGAFVSEEEMKNVVDYLKGDELPSYNEAIVNRGSGGGNVGTLNMFGGPSDEQDALFEEAKKIVVESGKASATLIQRRLRVGYARAARLLDELEEAGIVGPAEGAKPRDVFTEHLRPLPEAELSDAEQSLDSGGTVFDEEEKEEEKKEEENPESKEEGEQL